MKAARLLLRIDIPFLAKVYDSFFKFDFYEGLLVEYAKHLKIAIEAVPFMERANIPPTRCFVVLRHLILWSMKDSLMAGGEIRAMEEADSHGEKFDYVERGRNNLERNPVPA